MNQRAAARLPFSLSMIMQPLLIASINHVLRRNSWALERLKTHSGKSALFECQPVTLALAVLDSGEVTAAAEIPPHVSIRCSPGTMLRVLVRDETVWKDIAVTGDAEFAATIHHVWLNLRWEVEEDLARVFGDVAAHRITQTAATLDRWRAQSFDNLARSFAEYWTEEQPLITSARDIGEFNSEVDRLRDDVARIEKRLERLLARSALS